MIENTSKKDSDIIAVYDGVLYVYHDDSWLEDESWSTDDELYSDFPREISGEDPFNKVIAEEDRD